MLKNGDLSLRKINLEDTDLILRWRNRDSVRRWFINQDELTEKEHSNWMKNNVFTGKVIQYIIEINDIPIGSVYFQHIDDKNKSAEFGIFIGEEGYYGMGYGSMATQLFLDYGFTEKGFHRIYLRVLANNERAINSYKKSGFIVEGTARDMEVINNEYVDITFMSIIR